MQVTLRKYWKCRDTDAAKYANSDETPIYAYESGWDRYDRFEDKKRHLCFFVDNTTGEIVKKITVTFQCINDLGEICIQSSADRNHEYPYGDFGRIQPGKTVFFNLNLWTSNGYVTEIIITSITFTLAGDRKIVVPQSDIFIEEATEKSPYKEQKAGGCYVATCVYGSYDCPEVWTLRRYRDDTLGASWYGRLFVRVYYAVSPTLVKWFGETRWFKRLWRGKLDRMVKKLQDKGVESTPYKDKNW
ncbi:MAG: hypothetical protein E7657_04415 [Ruminococcaceae bacterium]|nr:hypothetical protein [Oscillospiraceae bacterium]